jgi:peptidoglycan hydrolase CwlO-like protein
LHRDLHAQYNARVTATSPSRDEVGLTADEKAALLQTQDTVATLTKELQKLRAANAAAAGSSTQQPGGPRGGSGGLMQKQAQCDAINPLTKQPYTMDELVLEIRRLQKDVAQVGESIVDVATATEERFAELTEGSAK